MVPDDLVTFDWCRRTGGALTASQRRRLLGRPLELYGRHAVDPVALAAGRRRTDPVPLPTAADDGVTVDPELLCVAGITHDAGAAEVVAGEDCTTVTVRFSPALRSPTT